MAAQTMAAILTRFETVLQADPLNLVPGDPFSDVATPNLQVDTTYRIVPGGLVRDEPTSPTQSVRVERVTVTMAKTLDMDGNQAIRDLHGLLDNIERYIVADALAQGYNVMLEKGSRKTDRPKETDLCRASLSFLCDYDFDSTLES